MTRFALLLLILSSLTVFSCSSRKNKMDRKDMIPEKDLVSILTDGYLTDGLLAMPKIRIRFPILDSLSTYNHILEKHGYSQKMLEKTLKYYFIKNPKKLIKIYDKVLGTLSEMESRIQKEIALSKEKTGNLWTGQDSYSFPDPNGTDSTVFDITFTKMGFYTLTLTAILFPDDQSVNPGLYAFSCHPDSIATGKREYVKKFNYIKDGQPHTYSIYFKVPVKKAIHVNGSLYDFDNYPDEWGKHMIIQNISITHSKL